MENTERKKKKKGGVKGNTTVFTLMVSNLIVLLGRLLFDGMLGETGMGYYATIYEFFTFIMLFTGWYLPQTEAKAVKGRLAKGQMKNAKRVLQGTMLFGVGFSLVISFFVIVLSEAIAKKWLLEPLNSLALCVMTPAVVLSVIISAYRGYFEGIGTVVPTNISRILEQVFALVFGMIFGKGFYNYGEKIGNLVQNSNYAPAYAVVGIVAGIIAAQILVLLFLVFLNRVFGRTLKKQMDKDNSKILDSYFGIIRNILVSGLPYILTMIFVQGAVFIDMILYMHYINRNTVQNYTIHYGSFYGKYCVIIGLFVCVLCFAIAKPLSAIVHFHKREEYRVVKDIFSSGIHTLAIYGISMAVLLAALAEPLTNMFFGKATGTVFLLQVSSALIFLVPCALFFNYVLQLTGKQTIALRNCAAAFIVQIVVVVILLSGAHAGIASIAFGYMFLFGSMTILNGMTLLRYLKYSPQYIRMFGVPFLASAICGILDMLLAKAMLEKVGATVTTIVCIILGCIGYVVLLFALNGINEKELSKIPGGALFIKFGQVLHFL